MIASDAIADAVESEGFTHIVWIPDSHLGTWDSALAARYSNRLIRVSREGEAIALTAGLMLGQARPLVIIQCTGFFEAGDALRNVIYDLHLPLKLLIGVRNARNYAAGTSKDSCADSRSRSSKRGNCRMPSSIRLYKPKMQCDMQYENWQRLQQPRPYSGWNDDGTW